MFKAAYLEQHSKGDLQNRSAFALQKLRDCDLCANYCHVDRICSPESARCCTGEHAVICSVAPHHGEERPISGRRGSGTIFFGWCNLDCVFCQNWELSHCGEGRKMNSRTLADQMLYLQSAGCHNINFVSASHVIPHILEALVLAVDDGLRVPLVYNTGGYDSPEGLALLEGIIDIYMPDMKFSDSAVAEKYLGVADYAEVNRAAVKEMYRQVGDLELDDTGIARRGLLVRHLVMPEDLAGTEATLRFLAGQVSRNTYLNLMGQYRPCGNADRYPELKRRPTHDEMSRLRNRARQIGLQRLD